MRAQPQPDVGAEHTEPLAVVGVEEELLDQTPPPDHEEFELVSARGLRAIKERWEKRRRKP